MRRTEDYKGCLVAYRGEVSQVLSRDNDAYQISVNITKGEYDWWDDAVLLIYSTDRGPRALDGDIVDFSGTVGELWETENLMGAPLFLPVIHVLALELESNSFKNPPPGNDGCTPPSTLRSNNPTPSFIPPDTPTNTPTPYPTSTPPHTYTPQLNSDLKVDGGIEEYAARYAGGPGAIYTGNINQLVGRSPGEGLGDTNNEVPYSALLEHFWIYESPYYESLISKANFDKPTALVSNGKSIGLQHVCINRTLHWCRLMEEYLAPRLRERSNGQISLSISSFPELGVAGSDTIALVRDGTLGMAEVYGGYVGGEYPSFEMLDLRGLWPDHETHYTVQTELIPDLDRLITREAGAKVLSHNWIFDDDQYFFSNDGLQSRDQFSNLKIRSHSATLSDWIEGIGAEPQYIAFAEVYPALERGILDAAVTGATSAYNQRWYEVSRFMNGPLISIASTTNVVNSDVWRSIPEDLQHIIIEENAKYELEALRIAGIQRNIGVNRNRLTGIEIGQFSDSFKIHSKLAAIEYVVPRWAERASGGSSADDAMGSFNRHVGPYIGLKLNSDWSVSNVPVTKWPRDRTGSSPTYVRQAPTATVVPTPTLTPMPVRDFRDHKDFQFSGSPWLESSYCSGEPCLRSGITPDGRFSTMWLNFYHASDSRFEEWMESNTISFQVKTSTESSDVLEFSSSARLLAQWSGSMGWTKQVFEIPGTRPMYFEWKYKKDAIGKAGDDAVWVKEIELKRH